MPTPITITRPCPIDLDALGGDRSGSSLHCSHCDAEVHALYKLTRAEAEAFVESKRGKAICISICVDSRGHQHFADSLVPVSRLRTPGRAAAGLALALTLEACTALEPAVVDEDANVDVEAYHRPPPTVPEQPALARKSQPADSLASEPVPTRPRRTPQKRRPPEVGSRAIGDALPPELSIKDGGPW